MPVQASRCCRSFGTLLCLVVEYQFIVWVDLIAHFNMGMPFEFFPVFLQFPLDLARTCTTSCQYIHWGAIEVSGLDSIWLLSISPSNEWTERRTSTLSFTWRFAQSFFNFWSNLAEICTTACQYMHWSAVEVSGLYSFFYWVLVHLMN